MLIESIITFAVMIGVLVMFHELGHFGASRLVGIRVEEFAFGFGPKLLTLFKRGDTEYTVHPFPLGGFVKLAGMEPGQEDIPDGYQAQSAWKRAFVIFSGPLMSFVLGAAVFVLVGLYWGYPDPFSPKNQVGMVNPKTEAARIGLRAGDRILEIDGVKIERGTDMIALIHRKPGQQVNLKVQRNSKTLKLTGTPRWVVRYMDAGWSFMNADRAQVEDPPMPDTLGARLLQEDDILLKFNGVHIRGGRQLVDAIEANGPAEAQIELLRDGKHITVTASPGVRWINYLGAKWSFPGAYVNNDRDLAPDSQAKKIGLRLGDSLVSISGKKIKTGEQMLAKLTTLGKMSAKLELMGMDGAKTVTAPGPESDPQVGYYDALGLLGFAPAPAFKRTSFVESVKMGVRSTISYATLMIKTFGDKKRLKEDVGGPVMIAKATADSVALGPYWVLFQLGALSLSLAFVNLLPIPVLDGGHLAILLVEGIRRKRLTLQQMATVQAFGLALIVMLVVVVLFSDISKLVAGKVPQ